jgi:CHRD domain-containing protein
MAGSRRIKLLPSIQVTARRRIVLTVLVAASATLVGALGPALGGSGATTAVRATLDVRSQVPRPAGSAGRATGVFVASLTGRTLAWRLTFHGLTGPATSVHLHAGRPGKVGPVLLKLCACPAGGSGRASVSATAATALRRRGAYLDVHTAANLRGEIRGQVALGTVPTLQILELQDGGRLTLPAAIRFAVTGFRVGPGSGRIVAITGDSSQPIIELALTESPGVAYLPDNKMLTGKRDLTFALAQPDGTLVANREARVTVFDVTLAGRR